MSELLIFTEVVFCTIIPIMFLLYFIYGIAEKIVHMMDKKELTEKKLEKYFWITSTIISILLGIFVLYIRNSL